MVLLRHGPCHARDGLALLTLTVLMLNHLGSVLVEVGIKRCAELVSSTTAPVHCESSL
jgi:hypothetical protein